MSILSCPLIRNLDHHLENLLDSFTIKTKYGAMAATVTPIVIFASIYICFDYTRRAWSRPKVYSRSLSLGTLVGGNLALERLIAYHDVKANAASFGKAEAELEQLLAVEYPDFSELQRTAAKLEMIGKEAVAEKILKRALQKAQNEGRSHEAYEIEMLLAEMYIYKGDFKKVWECECLKNEEISDARRPLYKAIIHVLLKHPKEEALKCWEEFRQLREQFLAPASSQDTRLERLVNNFEEFEKVVTVLQHDISRK